MPAAAPVPDVYVFVSDNGEICALTTAEDGSNLPCSAAARNWARRDVVPMTAAAVGRYAPHTDIALTNLIMRGYHMIRVSAQIVAFPDRRRGPK